MEDNSLFDGESENQPRKQTKPKVLKEEVEQEVDVINLPTTNMQTTIFQNKEGKGFRLSFMEATQPPGDRGIA